MIIFLMEYAIYFKRMVCSKEATEKKLVDRRAFRARPVNSRLRRDARRGFEISTIISIPCPTQTRWNG